MKSSIAGAITWSIRSRLLVAIALPRVLVRLGVGQMGADVADVDLIDSRISIEDMHAWADHADAREFEMGLHGRLSLRRHLGRDGEDPLAPVGVHRCAGLGLGELAVGDRLVARGRMADVVVEALRAHTV